MTAAMVRHTKKARRAAQLVLKITGAGIFERAELAGAGNAGESGD